MNLQIHRTENGTIKFPPHKHDFWEIVLYIEGTGYLYTQRCNIPFESGTIVLVPPGFVHGSVSENGFINISIGGNFENLLLFSDIIVLSDNSEKEGESLARLLYKNRSSDNLYLSRLAEVFVLFILQTIGLENPINSTVNEIVSKISSNYSNSEFKPSLLLANCGYSEDYIRQQFKKITGMHPTEFLHKTRIERAKFMIDIYGNTMSLSAISEHSGYTDYVYFSKKFKEYLGLSPKEYLKSVLLK